MHCIMCERRLAHDAIRVYRCFHMSGTRREPVHDCAFGI